MTIHESIDIERAGGCGPPAADAPAFGGPVHGSRVVTAEINALRPGAFRVSGATGPGDAPSPRPRGRVRNSPRGNFDIRPSRVDDFASARDLGVSYGEAEPRPALAPPEGRGPGAVGADLRAIVSTLMQGTPGGDDRVTVEMFAGRLPMGRLHHPAATDGGRPSNGGATAEGGAPAEAGPGESLAGSLGSGSGDECAEVRVLMPDYLLRLLDSGREERVVSHVRTCDECYDLLMDIRIQSEVEADERRRSR
jgi:hypothetical protein